MTLNEIMFTLSSLCYVIIAFYDSYAVTHNTEERS